MPWAAWTAAILKNAKAGTEELRDGSVGSTREFYGGQPLADDLTLVVAKVLPEAQGAEAAA